jgi:Sec-independent protein translocase protein TatA
MLGFGTEIVLFAGLGYVVLGPKQMYALLGRVAKAKADFDKATQELKSQLAGKLEDVAEVREERLNDRRPQD